MNLLGEEEVGTVCLLFVASEKLGNFGGLVASEKLGSFGGLVASEKLGNLGGFVARTGL